MVGTATICAGEGPYRVEASVTVMSRGIVVAAYSPEYAHVGATAQAIPRPEPGRTATVSILAVPCHRDEGPAHDIAADLATRFGVPAVASVGLHVNDASSDDIAELLASVELLTERIAYEVERMGICLRS